MTVFRHLTFLLKSKHPGLLKQVNITFLTLKLILKLVNFELKNGAVVESLQFFLLGEVFLGRGRDSGNNLWVPEIASVTGHFSFMYQLQ